MVRPRSSGGTQPSEFPVEATFEEQAKFLLRYAILAPSSHNTQPWEFLIEDRAIHLYRDLSRWLRVADADRRELHLSLGCVLENLLIAARYFGFEPIVRRDDGSESDRVASVELESGTNEPSGQNNRLFRAIPDRRTNHHPFRKKPLSRKQVNVLESVATEDEIRVQFVEESDSIRALTHLHEEANRRLFSHAAFRKELGMWIGRGAFGDSWLRAHIAKLVVTYVDLGDAQAGKDARLIESSPLLVLVGTTLDTPQLQIRTGQLIERLWLTATDRNLGVQPMSAALEVPELRTEVANLFALEHAQHLFRVGYPKEEEEPTPRRPLEQVLR